MTITRATETELSLLITGLRAICISDAEHVRHKLAIQLECELATRYQKMVGTWAEQERAVSR